MKKCIPALLMEERRRDKGIGALSKSGTRNMAID
jgi:hypothetical protein